MQTARPLALSLALLIVSATGCHTPAIPTALPANLHSPYTGYTSATYSRDAMWLCRPGMSGDACSTDLSATEVAADGTRTVVPHQPAADPKVDCFYIYPTVDLSLLPANHTDFADREAMRWTTVSQAAHFTEACAVYAPLYRQITIGTYFTKDERRESFQATAFSDVLDAFLHYMGQYNHGRKVVLIGHSQGADMIARLMQRVFDQDPVMRERLLLALPIGGPIETAKGQLANGNFKNIPLCSRADEQGCVVSFRTFRAGGDTTKGLFPAKPGNETACVNPVEPGSSEHKRLSRTYYPVGGQTKKMLRGVDGITTPFVLYRNYYEAVCTTSPTGYRYLGISPVQTPGDKREAPVDLTASQLNRGLGTHILDMQLTQGDLVDLVKRAASDSAAPPPHPDAPTSRSDRPDK